jgi:membrane-associated phospholipid phosphatase
MGIDCRSAWAWAPPVGAVLLLVLVVASGSDQSLFLALNHFGKADATGLWVHLTVLGDGAVALALVLPWIRRRPHCFWAALVAAALVGLMVQGIKQVVSVPRPLGVFAAEHFFQAGPGYRAVSFPSGHAATAFALAGIWIMTLPGYTLARTLLLATAVLVSLSRIMVGVHWPLDVLTGAIAGWLAAITGLQLACWRNWKTCSWAGFIAGLVLLGVAASLLMSQHIGIPAVLPLQRALGLLCLVLGAWEMFQMLPRGMLRRQPKGD